MAGPVSADRGLPDVFVRERHSLHLPPREHGGLVGVVTGFGIQIWMSMDWPIKIAGKNFAAIPPMWIIGFELTILFGGILTILGLVGLGGLYPRKLDEHYSPRFSAEEFGVVVSCAERDVAEVEALMRSHNAKEVTLHEDH